MVVKSKYCAGIRASLDSREVVGNGVNGVPDINCENYTNNEGGKADEEEDLCDNGTYWLGKRIQSNRQDLYCLRMREACSRDCSGFHIFSLSGYPFHLIRYCRRLPCPL